MRSTPKRNPIKARTSPNRRKEILDAARKVLSERGLSGATTKQIADDAGCSEGTLYLYFKGRTEIFLAVLEECVPDIRQPMMILAGSIGKNTPESNLERAARGILKFHRQVSPLLAALFAEPMLLAAYRRALVANGKGPHLAISSLERYIKAEQALGRLDTKIDPATTAVLLMGGCFLRAFTDNFFDKPMGPPPSRYIRTIIHALLRRGDD
jgi:AcrR family transcriptional regulator